MNDKKDAMGKILKISKLDAAKRQLEIAIRLYFSYGDPVSIHTLASASYNIIRDITLHRGETMFIKDDVLDFVKDEYREELRRKFNEAENFFKHADRDHDAVLDFRLVNTEFFLLEACLQYSRLTSENPPVFKVYRLWFITNKPNCFKLTEEQKRLHADNAPVLISEGREAFFRDVLAVAMAIKN